MRTVPCPGCHAQVEPKYNHSRDAGGKRFLRIPSHNPPPKNMKGLNPQNACPGVGEKVLNYTLDPGLVV